MFEIGLWKDITKKRFHSLLKVGQSSFSHVQRTYFFLLKRWLLRWLEPIYMRVGYVFESRFSAGTISPISMIFGILRKCYSFSCKNKHVWDVGIYFMGILFLQILNSQARIQGSLSTSTPWLEALLACGCLLPRRLSLDENVRAKEGGKETTGDTCFACCL